MSCVVCLTWQIAMLSEATLCIYERRRGGTGVGLPLTISYLRVWVWFGQSAAVVIDSSDPAKLKVKLDSGAEVWTGHRSVKEVYCGEG